MDADLSPVAPNGMTCVTPGLRGGTTHVAERVTHTVGERVRQKCMSVPQPKFVLTDAAFEFRSACMAWIVTYVGLPLIGRIMGFSNLSTSISTELAVMVGGGAGGAN